MLTGKVARFVAEYVKDGDGAKAARRAGYAPKAAKVTASRLLKKAEVRLAIEAERLTVVSQPAVVEHGTIALATERRERLSAILRTDPSGIVAIKAVDVLNRMDGIYVQKHEVEHAGGVVLKWAE